MYKTKRFLSRDIRKLQIIIAVCGLVFGNIAVIAQAHAATYMTHATVMEYNMDTSGSSAVAFAFTAGAADAAGSMTLNFGTWGGSVNAVQSITTAGCTTLTGATNALPTSGTLGASGAGQIVTVTSVNNLTSGQSYCAILSSATAVTNPAAAGVHPVVITDGTDSGTPGIDVIANDAVSVTATVAPTFTMSLGSNSDPLGTLSSTTLTSTTGVTTTVATNAVSGWFMWAEDSNAGLRSTIQAHTVGTITPGTNTAMNGGNIGSEKYALGVTSVGGTVAAPFADAGGTTGGGLSNSAYNQIASGTTSTNGATVVTKELADIAATTPPATDYADTITLVGAGSF